MYNSLFIISMIRPDFVMGLCDILNLEDLDEPACMNKILMYLEEIKEEDDMFMELLLDKLRGEEIMWKQPWYQQTNSLSRPLKERDEKHEEMYRKDTICKAEHKKILRNWHKLIDIYDIPDKLKCLARWKNKDKCRSPNTREERARRFIISYLAQGLQRTPFQIFRHIQTYYGCPVKGAYSAEEEKIMHICFTHHPNNCVTMLSAVLGREPRGIYKRLKQLYDGKPEHKRMKWTLPLATKFVNRLMKYTGLPLEELENRTFDKDVWLKLEKKFDQNYVHLQKFWYNKLHIQLFIQKSVKLNKLRQKIFEQIQLFPYKIWSDIRWKDIASCFSENYPIYFLYELCYRVVHQKRNYQKVPLTELIEFGLQSLKRCRKRRLKTLRLNKDGYLETIKYKNHD